MGLAWKCMYVLRGLHHTLRLKGPFWRGQLAVGGFQETHSSKITLVNQKRATKAALEHVQSVFSLPQAESDPPKPSLVLHCTLSPLEVASFSSPVIPMCANEIRPFGPINESSSLNQQSLSSWPIIQSFGRSRINTSFALC